MILSTQVMQKLHCLKKWYAHFSYCLCFLLFVIICLQISLLFVTGDRIVLIVFLQPCLRLNHNALPYPFVFSLIHDCTTQLPYSDTCCLRLLCVMCYYYVLDCTVQYCTALPCTVLHRLDEIWNRKRFRSSIKICVAISWILFVTAGERRLLFVRFYKLFLKSVDFSGHFEIKKSRDMLLYKIAFVQ